MSGKRGKRDVDAEVDLHGCSAEQLRTMLQQKWSGWRGLNAVRIVHGQGVVLKPEIVRWCEEMGIPYLPDAHNAGAVRIFPRQRTLPDSALATSLKDKGLTLTPEQEAYLRDPARIELERKEALRRKQEEERKRQEEAAARIAQRRKDDAMWQAEIARLGVIEKKQGKKAAGDAKPRPPIVLPPVQIKFEEGYWRAELSRVADTDTETLKIQKRTGLDKLAPPMKEETKGEKKEQRDGAPEAEQQGRRSAGKSQREIDAEKALFEEEMARLGGLDGFGMARAKRE